MTCYFSARLCSNLAVYTLSTAVLFHTDCFIFTVIVQNQKSYFEKVWDESPKEKSSVHLILKSG